MKYLKRYKLFESLDSSNEIKEYLHDIFLELMDDGYNVDINRLTTLYDFSNVYTVLIYKSDRPLAWSPTKSDRFRIKDVLEPILTADSYMKSQNYKISRIEVREIKSENGHTDFNTYDSSVLKNGRREQSRELFTLNIEFSLN